MSKWEEAVWLRVEARIAEDAEEQKEQPRKAVLNSPRNLRSAPVLETVAVAADTSAYPQPSHYRSSSPTRLESRLRILIADDSPPVRRQLRRLIESQLPGAVIEEAEDGRVAVEKVTRTSPDIAILDIAMPVLNGLLATEKITAIDPELPVIVHTMYATPQMEGEVRKRGARAVVPKDDVRGLLSVIERLSRDEIGMNPALA